MAEKAPAFLYEQFIENDLDDKETQMVGSSFQHGQDEANRILAEFAGKEGISIDMAALRLVLIVSGFLFRRGMDNIVLTNLSELAKKGREEENSSIGKA